MALNRCRTLTLSLAAVLLPACGQAEDSFNESFESSYAEEFIASCQTGIVGAGATEDFADALCRCGAEQSAEQLSVSERMAPSDENMGPIMEQCLAELSDHPDHPQLAAE